jgi:CO/xanthine dehydrogenase FAD-binding subunit
MKPAPFKFLSPESLEEALQLISAHADDGKLLAGGQSLVPAMNFRLVQPAVLIDLNRVAELGFIRPSKAGGLQIGAMTRQSQIEHSQEVRQAAPLLFQTLPRIAHRQIRNRGTLGGSLVHADPAAELPVAATALRCRFKLASTRGERWVETPSFFVGMFTTAVQPDEILVEVEVPPNTPRTGWSFQEVARRSGDYAMAGVAAMVALDDDGTCAAVRLVYLNVGDGPVEAAQAAEGLIGHQPEAAKIEEAARKAAEDEMAPYGNMHATPEYQRHLARVLTVRALTQATEMAAG